MSMIKPKIMDEIQEDEAILHATIKKAIDGSFEAESNTTSIAEDKTPRGQVIVEPLETHRLSSAKEGFTTRRVPKEDMRTLIKGSVRPCAGDIVLARVDRIRQHGRIELPSGRKVLLEEQNEIIVACGNRYATDQFEAFVPQKLGKAHLIAAGGVVAVEVARARKMKPATEITLLGLVGDASGVPLNTLSYALPAHEINKPRCPVVAVLGTSMNSGKTTTARFLACGLKAAGFRVGYAKITGTGAGHDYWSLLDSGVSAVVDFTDAGLVSTYKMPVNIIETISMNLIGYLVAEGCNRIVVEVADGLLQSETAALIRSSVFQDLTDRVLFASSDPLSAIEGVKILQEAGFDVAGVSGLLTASPLPLREAKQACKVPVLDKADLMNPETAANLAVYSAAPSSAPVKSPVKMRNLEMSKTLSGLSEVIKI
jgi:molybdopterin-guanine dinucleotide biosynthesis protein